MDNSMILDGLNRNKENGSVVYAKNKVLDSLRAFHKNEDGFLEIGGFENNVSFCGSISTPTDIIIFYTFNITYSQYSVIARLNTNTNQLTRICCTILDPADEPGFRFSVSNPIQGTFSYNNKKELIISFIEGVGAYANSIRTLNCDNLPFVVIPNPGQPDDMLLSNHSDMQIIESNRPLDLPIGTLVTIGSGQLPIGVYEIYIGYVNGANSTNYISSMNPITIYSVAKDHEYFDVYDTDDLDTITFKAIVLNVLNLSPLYSEIKIGVIHTINGASTAYEKTISYTTSLSNLIIDELTSFKSVSISSIALDNVIYTKANAITKQDKQVLIGNLKTRPRYDFTEMASNITMRYECFPVDGSQGTFFEDFDITKTYKDEHMITNNRTFQPDEVYALYVAVVYNDGSESEAFHIPGRVSQLVNSAPWGIGSLFNETAVLYKGDPFVNETTADLIDVDFNNTYKYDYSIGGSQNDKVKLYQCRNHAMNDSIDHVTQTGPLSYWENKDEVYPGNHPFAGQKVRHHKIPDYTNYAYDTVETSYPSSYKKLGVRLKASNIVIPEDIIDDVQYVRFYFAKRGGINISVYDEALKNPMFNNVPASSTHKRPIGSLTGFNGFDSVYNQFGHSEAAALFKNVRDGYPCLDYNLYSPKLQKYNNPLQFDYIKVENVIKFTVSHIIHDWCNLAPHDPQLAFGVNDQIIEEILHTNDDMASYKLFLNAKILDKQYLTAGALHGNGCDMNGAEDCIYVKLEDERIAYDPVLKLMDTGANGGYGIGMYVMNVAGDLNFGIDTTEYPYVTCEKVLLKRFVNNMYLDYTKQDLAMSGQIATSNLYPADTCDLQGDSYYSDTAFRTAGHKNKCLGLLPYYSNENFELRTPDLTPTVLKAGKNSTGSELKEVPTEDNYWANHSLCKYLPKWSYLASTSNYPNSRMKWLNRHGDIVNYWGVGIRSIKHDWAKLNDLKMPLIYNYRNDLLTDFPYRIHKSQPIQTDGSYNGWLDFVTGNHQEINNSKGEIMTLDAADKAVYVRSRYALFVYQLLDSMQAIGMKVSLESEDIFARNYEEIIHDSQGYIGSNGRFDSLVTPYGYYTLDVENRKFYKVLGVSAHDITSGVTEFLRDNLNNGYTNPFITESGGYCLGYNDEDKMVLLTSVRTIGDNFTLSFGVHEDAAISFHDYMPSMYARSTNSLLSFKQWKDDVVDTNAGVYKHNKKGTKCKYYRVDGSELQVIYPDIIDRIFNDFDGNSKFTNKQLQSISWISDVFSNPASTYKIHFPNYTANQIMLYSDNQAIDYKTVNTNSDYYDTAFGRNSQNVWSFNEIFDEVVNNKLPILDTNYEPYSSNLATKDYFDMSDFIGTFVVFRLKHLNLDYDGTPFQLEHFINMMTVKFKQDKR